MDRIIKTEKGIPKITVDHYPDKPLFKVEFPRYNIDGADELGYLGKEYPTSKTGREQVSYNKRGK